MTKKPHLLRYFLPAAVITALAVGNASAATWNLTAASSFPHYEWNVNGNWTGPSLFPNAAGDVANLNINILGNQVIRLQQNITLGTLNMGDTDSSTAGTTTLSVGSLGNGNANTLTFDSGVSNVAAQINLSNPGTSTTLSTLNVNVTQNSDLIINMGGVDASNSQRLTFNGAGNTSSVWNLNGKNITVTGGITAAQSSINFNGVNSLVGDANTVITNNSQNSMTVDGDQTLFLGTFVLNGRASGSNTTTLSTGQSGSVENAKEIIINGALSAGTTQLGGAMQTGQGSTSTSNPGQRLTQNKITFNGGSLTTNGQALSAAVVNRTLTDNVAEIRANSGYSLITASGTTTAGTESKRTINITSLTRGTGATMYIRSSHLNNPSSLSSTTISVADGAAGHLVGAGGANGSTTMSIIPWLQVANTNGSQTTPDSFGTYDTTLGSLRGLTNAEYSGSMTSGASNNVSVSSFGALASDTVVNSLRLSGNATNVIGTGRKLSVASGAIVFSSGSPNTASLGGAGAATAGTLEFGNGTAVEGVVFTNGSFVNTIGAVVAGTGGMTKSGTGTLTLAGLNTYTGLTYVGSGILRVGDGTNASRLGQSDASGATVANGATLRLSTGADMIDDDATVTLQNFGLLNGKMLLDSGVNETVGNLVYGNLFQVAGTYGSSASTATFKSDIWFDSTGTGILTVLAIPEPSALIALVGGLGMLVFTRRRSS